MSVQIDSIFEEIEYLLKNQGFVIALQKLDSINLTEIASGNLAYCKLLRCETKLRLGDYNIEDDLNWAIAYYKDGGDNQRYAKARYLQGWLMSITGDSFNAKEVRRRKDSPFKRSCRV